MKAIQEYKKRHYKYKYKYTIRPRIEDIEKIKHSLFGYELYDLKIVSLEKENIITKDKMKEMIIKGLNALKNINNISKEDEEILRELGLIKYRSEKAILTHSGIKLLKLIRNKKLKEEELYELLKSDMNDSFK